MWDQTDNLTVFRQTDALTVFRQTCPCVRARTSGSFCLTLLAPPARSPARRRQLVSPPLSCKQNNFFAAVSTRKDTSGGRVIFAISKVATLLFLAIARVAQACQSASCLFACSSSRMQAAVALGPGQSDTKVQTRLFYSITRACGQVREKGGLLREGMLSGSGRFV